MKLVTLRNATKQQQSVVLADGKQIVFEPLGKPNSEHMFTEKVAGIVREQLGDVVVDAGIDEIGGVAEPEQEKTTVWLANMTGDPDAPATMFAGYKRDKYTKVREAVTVDNPNLAPRTITREMKGAQKHYVDDQGIPQGYSTLGFTVSIPPYKRVELPQKMARWFLGREGRQAAWARGAVIKSRAPWKFEPDINWDLDNLRDYLLMLDPKAEVGKYEFQVRKVAKEMGEDEAVEVHKSKVLLMKRIFKRLADPKYTDLPTTEKFEAFQKVQANRKAQFLKKMDQERAQ